MYERPRQTGDLLAVCGRPQGRSRHGGIASVSASASPARLGRLWAVAGWPTATNNSRRCSLQDVRHARDVLGAVLRGLPRRPRTELGRLVAALDAVYLDRTLPDPLADLRREWRPDVWWYRRLEGCRYAATGVV